jgi:hypothetical protein
MGYGEGKDRRDKRKGGWDMERERTGEVKTDRKVLLLIHEILDSTSFIHLLYQTARNGFGLDC